MLYIIRITILGCLENPRYDIPIARPASRTYRHAAKSRRILFAAREIHAPTLLGVV